MRKMNIIDFKNVSFSYAEGNETERPAIEDLSFSVEKGEFVSIIGHNGSGKSTVAKLISGILQPTCGKIFINGMDACDEKNILDIRRACGMVFQNPDNQIVSSIVEEDVAFAPENMGIEPTEIRRRVDNALAAVGMSDYKRHAPHLLSGGQKQRIAIAGVLAMLPECIVMDEPTAMLDPKGREEVMNTVMTLRRELGMTIILITHHMDEVSLCDRIITINNGRLDLCGTPGEVFQNVERLDEIGLSVPATVRLAHELSRCGVDIKKDALTCAQCAEQIGELIKSWRDGI